MFKKRDFTVMPIFVPGKKELKGEHIKFNLPNMTIHNFYSSP
jgi:hypothetical protein